MSLLYVHRTGREAAYSRRGASPLRGLPRPESVTKPTVRQWLTPLLPLLIPACILELLYLVILALAPLPELHLASSPLADAWPWTLALSHLLFPGAWSSSNASEWLYPLLLGGTLIALTGTYALAIRDTFRRLDGRPQGSPPNPPPPPPLRKRWARSQKLFSESIQRMQSTNSTSLRWLFLLLGGALVFGLTLLLQPALFSDDVFTYIFSGRILTIYHAAPMNTAPIQFAHDPYLQWVISGRNAPNIYGPLWLIIASLLVGIGNGLVATLLLFKGLALLSHLINCILLWAILGKIAPTRRLVGTLLYAWNPLVLIELAGSGHNEGVLLSLLLLATWLHVQGERRWHQVGALILFGLAISTNLIALLIVPLYIWFIVRTERYLPRAIWGFCWRSLIVLAFVLMIYLPFWRGPSTFFAITSAVDMQHFIHSPIGTLTGPIRGLFTFVAQWEHYPPIMQPTVAADVTLRASAIFIFALIYIHLFGKLRHATTTIAGMRYSPDADQAMELPGFDVLLNSWSIAVFWYLILVSGVFWPWYILWGLWIVVMRCIDTLTITVLLLAGTALFTYPFLDFAGSPIATYQPILIFGIPLVYLLWARKRHTERNKPSYE